ncbi:MAG: GntR family transcriptional regulator [Clostridiales bacterium]|nr:GntR family transcriptional regulator [Clostridiales bacterium]
MTNDKKYYQVLSESILKKQPFLKNTELAYEMILEEVLRGRLIPGEKILQENLAVLFDMSRTPVRDALLRLEQEGFLEHNEKNGFQVQNISLKDYVDFCEFRLLLEPKAAYFAARNISVKQMERLKHNIDEFKEAATSDNFYQKLILDNEFHSIIAKASDNSYIYETIQRYRSRAIFHMLMIPRDERSRYVLNKHIGIYQALSDNDEERAEQMMRSHLQFYLKNIYDLYQ